LIAQQHERLLNRQARKTQSAGFNSDAMCILAAVRYFFCIAFDGSKYHGWQKQTNGISVQEVIEQVLLQFTGEAVEVTGCGRTDTGVHASKFYFHADIQHALDESVIHNLNCMLPRDIVLYNIIPVNGDAHARFDARERTYVYHIHFYKNPFKGTYSVYQFPAPDIEKMNEACERLLTHTDFKCFSKSNTQVKHYECFITHASWKKINDGMEFEITANRFLRNMVRAIVGTMLDLGNGKISMKDFEDILQSGNRSRAGTSVPAKGLFLTRVVYPFIAES
jgi:tRNA pseudouridine38-40 synthase